MSNKAILSCSNNFCIQQMGVHSLMVNNGEVYLKQEWAFLQLRFINWVCIAVIDGLVVSCINLVI